MHVDNENQGTLIVTGGSRGIGAAISRLAAAQGYSVAVNYLKNDKAAAALIDEIERVEAVAPRFAPMWPARPMSSIFLQKRKDGWARSLG